MLMMSLATWNKRDRFIWEYFSFELETRQVCLQPISGTAQELVIKRGLYSRGGKGDAGGEMLVGVIVQKVNVYAY